MRQAEQLLTLPALTRRHVRAMVALPLKLGEYWRGATKTPGYQEIKVPEQH